MNKVQFEVLEVSTDKGQTWSEQQINILDLTPENSILKVGDWIKRNDTVYEVKICTHEKMKGLLQATIIKGYTVANRSFNNYNEAIQYCNYCDLDIELNIETL